MYTVYVTIHVIPEHVDAFCAATEDNHRNTRLEAGNLRFDVLRDNDDPNCFYLYEVYQNEDAFRGHQQTEHYHRWRETVADMMATPRSACKATSIYPEPWA
jgi:autoinducer 2-degrading protein